MSTDDNPIYSRYGHPYNFHLWPFSRRNKVYKAWHVRLVFYRQADGKQYLGWTKYE